MKEFLLFLCLIWLPIFGAICIYHDVVIEGKKASWEQPKDKPNE